MDRAFYLKLAEQGSAFPIGVDLVLHEQEGSEGILTDGARLGGIIAAAARRYQTPLAFPHMDLRLEKDFLLEQAGVPADGRETYVFREPLPAGQFSRLSAGITAPLSPRMRACCGAIGHIARQTDLVPVGMCTGPFTLMTKLIEDPIVPIYLLGAGGRDDPGAALVEQCLELALAVCLRYLSAQQAAGARAAMIIEPSVNTTYMSPAQLEGNPALFDRLVMRNLERINRWLGERGMDLILHDCGELTDDMVAAFGRLNPAILSLGSSRVLWDDARLLPKTTVLYGNLPSKHFYSDQAISLAQVSELGRELRRRMRAAQHPFILGTECDVLHVPRNAARIKSKIDAFMRG